jgi:cyclophilin family peptidyl-prolyl cis-trans isomerase
MANKRTRDRQLAKLAARRQAQRRAQRRKRNAALAVGVVVALVAVAAGFFTLTAGDDRPARARASGTPSPTPSAGVACGAKAPKAAGRAKPTFSKPPRMTIDPATTYTAAVETSCGAIAVRLDAERAPETVNSFVFLANDGFYDGLTFHRIANSIDVIQGGDPSGNGTGGPGYSLDDELTGRERYTTGTVAMANSGPDTAGSQFFIVTGPKASSLPKDYTVFGEVVRGLDTARRIQGLPVNGETPARTVYIDEVTISER